MNDQNNDNSPQDPEEEPEHFELHYDPSRPLEDQIGELPHIPEEVLESLKKMAQKFVGSRFKTSAVKDRPTDVLMPSDAQLALKPGDRAVETDGLHSGKDIGAPLTIVEMIDAEEYKDIYPDWEERLWKGRVLCRYWTHMELSYEADEPEMGWFSRLHLIRLPENYMWEEARGWVMHGHAPFDPPEWLVRLMVDAQQKVNKANGHTLPGPGHCENCGSSGMVLKLKQIVSDVHMYCEKQDEDAVFTCGQYSRLYETTKVKACMGCGFEVDLDENGTQIHMGVPKDLETHTLIN